MLRLLFGSATRHHGAMIIERVSAVDGPAERVWARVVTPEGINDELAVIVRSFFAHRHPRLARHFGA